MASGDTSRTPGLYRRSFATTLRDAEGRVLSAGAGVGRAGRTPAPVRRQHGTAHGPLWGRQLPCTVRHITPWPAVGPRHGSPGRTCASRGKARKSTQMQADAREARRRTWVRNGRSRRKSHNRARGAVVTPSPTSHPRASRASACICVDSFLLALSRAAPCRMGAQSPRASQNHSPIRASVGPHRSDDDTPCPAVPAPAMPTKHRAPHPDSG